ERDLRRAAGGDGDDPEQRRQLHVVADARTDRADPEDAEVVERERAQRPGERPREVGLERGCLGVESGLGHGATYPGRTPATSTVSVSCPERRSAPGRSPVSSPPRTISVPFTRTCSMPSAAAYRRPAPAGRSRLVWTGPGATRSSSKTTTSAYPPSASRPRSRMP